MSEERIITEQEERVLRLTHHDFDGYPTDVTARIMGITVKEVKALLRSVRRKAPQLFPILSIRQRAILTLYSQHLSRSVFAESLNITITTLKKELRFLRKYGFLPGKIVLSYVSSEHDEQIKEVF